ncbi:EF-hand calcium-binding domain-containing protein 4A isoform X2 [Gouania willdenowi]|uniref:EF-hand calcium-binding domain-containing protein 4A isoform X2 n=1 Tax=Gouania willdenowi TaxID=441366 RepID=UPI0010544A7C|nr:EF-hand calcium-binding domain-containing protein 4A isoform X2 [Gouania willdenowi]
MSLWLNDGEVLVAEGSGEALPLTPRSRSVPPASPGLSRRSSGSPQAGRRLPGSPRQVRGRSPVTSPLAREPTQTNQVGTTMGKAKELFVLCDKEGKGFLTKQDMQNLQGELPLSPEQLETVFDRLDRDSNGFLTPVEFSTGLGELVGLEEDVAEKPGTEVDWYQEPTAVRFINTLVELGADQLFKDQQELSSLWCELQRDSPELLSVLENVLIHAASQLQDAAREREGLEQTLRRRESEHDQVVRSIYEETETQIKEEREKHLSQDSVKEKLRGQQLEEELLMKEQELENILSKQKELHTRIRQLSCEQTELKEQNQQLLSSNKQLQEQVESSREQLQAAVDQLKTMLSNADQEQTLKHTNVMRVSKNMKKEKESLMRQLEILKDMNRNLRDEKDAQQCVKRTPNVSKLLQKRGSVIGNYLLQERPVKRQLSSSDELEQDKDREGTKSSWTHQLSSCTVRCESVEQDLPQKTVTYDSSSELQSSIQSHHHPHHPQRVFKVVFLGNSGVGKSSFIQHYCTGRFLSALSSTVGLDFQIKTLTLDSTTITLQLWDTAGQERFRSITEQYFRKADGILALYDVTNPASFSAVRGWIDSAKEKMCAGAVLVLLGNKQDSADSPSAVPAAEGRRLAEQHQALFYECSAKTGANMERLMKHLARGQTELDRHGHMWPHGRQLPMSGLWDSSSDLHPICA